MSILRSHLLSLACLIGGMADAQSVQRRHLITSLGGGAGLLDLASTVDSLSTTGTAVGAVRFAFGYAVIDRWSLGFHYDRIGTDEYPGAVDRVRFTTYLLEAAWRPWTGPRAALELHAGFGPSIMVLRPRDARLPYQATGGTFAFGVRYLRLIGNTLGIFLSADHSRSSQPTITLDGEVQRDADGSPISFNWRSPRINGGMLVRF